VWILIKPIVMITQRFFRVLKIIHNKYYLPIVIILFTNISFVFGQEKNFRFSQIKLEDGLSQSSIYCIHQDKKGYLWFGTANGLNRYDGYSFKVYSSDPFDTTTISDNSILSICEDENGIIWIGTTDGILNRYDRKTGIFKRINITAGLKSNPSVDQINLDFPLPYSRYNERSITSIVHGKDDFLYIGTWGLGLIKYDKNSGGFVKVSYDSGSLSEFNFNRIKKIINDGNDLWIGTFDSGLFKLVEVNSKRSIVHYKHSPKIKTGLSSNQIIDLLKDKENNIWIATYGGGLNFLSSNEKKLPQDKVTFRKFFYDTTQKNSISSNFITALIQDQSGFIWVGTFGGGLNKYNPQSNLFINFKNEPNVSTTISKNEILSLYEDSSGNIWIGAHLGKGLSKYEPNGVKFEQLSRDPLSKNSLNDDVVWAIWEEENKNLLIGTYKGGLNKWDRNKNKFFSYQKNLHTPFSISDNHVRAILYDDRGFFWIGTFNGGLNIFYKDKFVNYKHNPRDTLSLGANQVQSVYVDKDKNTWVGTFGGGLNKIDPFEKLPAKLVFKKFKHDPNNPFSLSDDRVYTIYEDSEGILWIGTFGGGLNKFDKRKENFICYKNISGDESSLSDNRVMGIYEDRLKNLWISTYGGGLLKFNRRTEKFIRYDKKNRLYSSVVYGVLEDNNGNLWISSDNGIFKFSPGSELFTKYDLSDGLQSLEFSGGALFKSRTGEMFFGGINGLNYFYPDSIRDNYFVPPVVISSIRVFNDPLKGEVDSVYLSYDQNFLSIEFSALDFTNPADNQYAYILEGIEDEWHYVDSKRRAASYTNLSPGEYIFRVKGSNNDGVWNSIGTQIHIFISPPYWQTWWFISLVVLFAASIIYYVGTVRYRNLLSIEKLKSKLSADLHDNIGSGLTEISILSELAANGIKINREDSVNKINAISEKARMLIDNMSDIVWMVNPRRDSLYHVILRLKDSYSDLLNSMGISFGTVNLEKFSSVKLQMEYKQNIFLIFKEAINNSLKHSGCRQLTFEANIQHNILELTLTDDGHGMDLEKIKYGNGIFNMKSRASLIGGSLDIESNNSGTKIKFRGKISWLK
jgi:ligand-binding sensor domain-containing protein/two-component sensor histidine kinase